MFFHWKDFLDLESELEKVHKYFQLFSQVWNQWILHIPWAASLMHFPNLNLKKTFSIILKMYNKL